MYLHGGERFYFDYGGRTYEVFSKEDRREAFEYSLDDVSNDMLENFLDCSNIQWRFVYDGHTSMQKAKMAEGVHEVYIGRVGGEPMYIGEGRLGRHKHLNSGKSNCYEANLYHFEGGEIEVEVIECPSKQYAKDLEKALILKHKPKWNKNFMPPEVKSD